ncbi:MAG: hypothetical protein ACHBNF_20015 [Chromatiales bacterium]
MDIHARRPKGTAVALNSASLIDFKQRVAPEQHASVVIRVSMQVGSLPTQARFLVTLNRHLRFRAIAASTAQDDHAFE